MEKIPNTFKTNGNTYELLKREKDVAIYKLLDIFEGYEVHAIRQQKASNYKTRDGTVISFKEKEILTNNEDFGTFGWFYPSLELAEKKMNQLLQHPELLSKKIRKSKKYR